MFFEYFILENYKGIEKIKIPLLNNKRPHCLLGLNESGKTTILEGIRDIGHHCSQLNKQAPVLDNGELNRIKPRYNSEYDYSIVFTCGVEDEGKKYKIAFEYIFEDKKHKNYKVWVDNSEFTLLSDSDKDFANGFVAKVPSVLYYDDFVLDVPKEITFFTSHYMAKSEEHMEIVEKYDKKNTTNKKWKEIINDIHLSYSEEGGGAKRSFQKDVVDFLDGPGAGSKNEFTDQLTRFSKHVNQKATAKWLDILGKESGIKEVELVCYDINVGVAKRHFSFRVVDKQGARFDLGDRSKGCRWFFSFILYTEFRKFRKQNTVFLLDEPASNLHASIQEEVIKVIQDVCNDDSCSPQVLYSTHSPYLLDFEIDKESIEGNNLLTVRNINIGKENKDPRIELKKLNLLRHNIRSSDKTLRPILDWVKINKTKLSSIAKKLATELGKKGIIAAIISSF